MDGMPGFDLVPLWVYGESADGLAQDLVDLVVDDRDLIGRAFPAVLRRYGTVEAARTSIIGNAQAMRDPTKGFAGWVLKEYGNTIGLATAQQHRLIRTVGKWPRRERVAYADGPLLACWTSLRFRRAINGRRPLLPLIMQRVALALGEETSIQFSGIPWTLVRPDQNPAIISTLLDPGNAFGGFRTDVRHDWRQVDGVRGERWVLKADRSVAALRAAQSK